MSNPLIGSPPVGASVAIVVCNFCRAWQVDISVDALAELDQSADQVISEVHVEHLRGDCAAMGPVVMPPDPDPVTAFTIGGRV